MKTKPRVCHAWNSFPVPVEKTSQKATPIPAHQFLSKTRQSFINIYSMSKITVSNHKWRQLLPLATPQHVMTSIFTEKPHFRCDHPTNIFGTCRVMNDGQSHDGKRFCSLRCKCAESADQYLIHIFSPGETPKNMSISEIKVTNIFWL